MDNELLQKNTYILTIQGFGKSQEEAYQDIFKKLRTEIHSKLSGYLVEMHVVSFKILDEKTKVYTKKFLGLFLPVEHTDTWIEAKLVAEVTELKK